MRRDLAGDSRAGPFSPAHRLQRFRRRDMRHVHASARKLRQLHVAVKDGGFGRHGHAPQPEAK